jgi:hypothetical protein
VALEPLPQIGDAEEHEGFCSPSLEAVGCVSCYEWLAPLCQATPVAVNGTHKTTSWPCGGSARDHRCSQTRAPEQQIKEFAQARLPPKA